MMETHKWLVIKLFLRGKNLLGTRFRAGGSGRAARAIALPHFRLK